MVGLSSTTFGLRWTELSVLGSQEFGQALMESCEIFLILKQNSFRRITLIFFYTHRYT